MEFIIYNQKLLAKETEEGKTTRQGRKFTLRTLLFEDTARKKRQHSSF